MKNISQVEARRLRKRVADLEAMETLRRSRYARSYPGGVNIAQHTFGTDRDYLPAVVNNSIMLGHAVVVIADGATLQYYAIPHPRMPA